MCRSVRHRPAAAEAHDDVVRLGDLAARRSARRRADRGSDASVRRSCRHLLSGSGTPWRTRSSERHSPPLLSRLSRDRAARGAATWPVRRRSAGAVAGDERRRVRLRVEAERPAQREAARDLRVVGQVGTHGDERGLAAAPPASSASHTRDPGGRAAPCAETARAAPRVARALAGKAASKPPPPTRGVDLRRGVVVVEHDPRRATPATPAASAGVGCHEEGEVRRAGTWAGAAARPRPRRPRRRPTNPRSIRLVELGVVDAPQGVQDIRDVVMPRSPAPTMRATWSTRTTCCTSWASAPSWTTNAERDGLHTSRAGAAGFWCAQAPSRRSPDPRPADPRR